MFTRRVVLAVADLGLVRRVIGSPRMYRSLARRFVAGETLEEALAEISGIHGRGQRVSLDFLGEKVTEPALAERVVEEYLHLLSTGLPQVDGLDATVSIKLSQLGLDIDREFCAANVRTVLDAAARAARMVRLDMEDSTYVDATLDLYCRMREEGRENVGVVLQAYLRRTPDDVRRLDPYSADVRLCKGAYQEPPAIALQRMTDIRRAMLELSRSMLLGRFTLRLATHDAALIGDLRRMLEELGRVPADVEFQMLLGVARSLQRQMTDEGYPMRIYVPYGREWYAYFSRRLAERPENLRFIARHMFRD